MTVSVKKTCEVCGCSFRVKPYRATKARFCSQKCGGTWHQSQRPTMGNRFAAGNKLRTGLRPTNAFTSEQVAGSANPKWTESIALVCGGCDSHFSHKPWLFRQNKSKNGLRFCTDLCRRTYMRGENHPRYIGGPLTYRGQTWPVRRAAAIERDNGTCQDKLCGVFVGDSIPVHHIRPFRLFDNEDEANRLENLICYCQSCHMKHEPRTVAA
jgi:5-methylcytosine-specific restriction endonuclease McrA